MEESYIDIKTCSLLPRLPLEGNIDITYRCNNHCRHCWVGIPADSEEGSKELSFRDIRRIVSDASMMGCRRWAISGGEPMIRPDFAEIFDFLTTASTSYAINTNGTFITPKIAKMMKRIGKKTVSIYGATAAVHDHVTRNPGSFEAAMRGLRYLKEAGAGFMVQPVPMKDNYHQFRDMIKLAESFGVDHQIGAAWLNLSSDGNAERNNEIIAQRLPPGEVAELDKPIFPFSRARQEWGENAACSGSRGKGNPLSLCIKSKRDFYVDPYGNMTFCRYAKDESMLFDLRRGGFREAWQKFIPSLADKVSMTEEFEQGCGICDNRSDCSWCPLHGFIENRNFSAKSEYLCAIAGKKRDFRKRWVRDHRRFFRIADMTIQVDSVLPFSDKTFDSRFKSFEVDGPGDDTISIFHYFSLPELKNMDIGKEVYKKRPWAIHRKDDSWIYLGISPVSGDDSLTCVAVFNNEYTGMNIYSRDSEYFLKGGISSLSLLATDQIFLGRVLADRNGFFLHSCGAILNDKGFIFVGHSEAGKTTIASMLKGKAEILCDDRIIVRKAKDVFKIYGTWSHGDLPDVSSGSAPIKAVFFLEKSDKNEAILIGDKKEIARRLMNYLVKPYTDHGWWIKTLSIVDEISGRVPFYVLKFDLSGEVVRALERF